MSWLSFEDKGKVGPLLVPVLLEGHVVVDSLAVSTIRNCKFPDVIIHVIVFGAFYFDTHYDVSFGQYLAIAVDHLEIRIWSGA